MNKLKLHRFTIILLLGLCIFLFYQWNDTRDDLNRSKITVESSLYSALHSTGNTLYLAKETLLLYRDDFTETEEELFQEAVISISSTLNYLGMTLDSLSNLNVYVSYIDGLERVLDDIGEKNITGEENIDSISESIAKHNVIYLDILFDAEIEDTNDKLERLTEVLEAMNNEIDEILEVMGTGTVS